MRSHCRGEVNLCVNPWQRKRTLQKHQPLVCRSQTFNGPQPPHSSDHQLTSDWNRDQIFLWVMFLSHISITFLKALLNISWWKAFSKAVKVKVNKVLNLFLPNCDLDYNMTSSWLRNLQLMMFDADWLQWSTSVHKAQRNIDALKQSRGDIPGIWPPPSRSPLHSLSCRRVRGQTPPCSTRWCCSRPHVQLQP